MSDPAAVLRPALQAWLKADSRVIAAYGANAVRIFRGDPPDNRSPPYAVIDGFEVEDDSAECLDATAVHVTVHVWSLVSDPIGDFSECEAIAGAVKASLMDTLDSGDSPAFSIAGHRVTEAQASTTLYLKNPDGRWAHGVVRVTLFIDPTT